MGQAKDEAGTAQRLFFALWPPQGIQEELARRTREVLEDRRARPVPGERIHLTLAFLGEVDAATRERAEALAGRVHGEAFTLSLDRMGYWPRKALLWAAPAHPPPALEDLAGTLREGLTAECGLPRERRSFRPHLTLARKAPKLPPRMVIEPVTWAVERFVLVASELDRNGPTYTVVGEWSLAQASEPET